MSDEHASPDFARMHGWDRDYRAYILPEVPTYVGPVSFSKRPWVEDAAALMLRAPDVAVIGAPIDEGVSYRPGARFGPRAIRQATYNPGEYSLQLGVEPFEVLDVVDAGDANIVPAWLERGHAMVFRKVLEVTASALFPSCWAATTRSRGQSASAVAQARAPHSVGIVHFDAHADTADEDWGVLAGHGTPMRRLIESGAVDGRNFVQVGPARLLAAARRIRVDERARHALAPHERDRGARRGGGH